MQFISRSFIYVDDRFGIHDGQVGEFMYDLECFPHKDLVDMDLDMEDLREEDKPDNLDDSFFCIISCDVI